MEFTDVPMDPTCPFDCCQVWLGSVRNCVENTYPRLGLKWNTRNENLRQQFLDDQRKSLYDDLEENTPIDYSVVRKSSVIVEQRVQSKFQSNIVSGSTDSSTQTNADEVTVAKKNKASYTYKRKIRQPKKISVNPKRKHPVAVVQKSVSKQHPQIPMPSPNPALVINLVLCKFCGRYCLSENDLSNHLEEMHNQPKLLTCLMCGTLCVGETSLKHHEQLCILSS